MSATRVELWERKAEWPLTVLAVVFLAAYAWPIVRPDLPEFWAAACRDMGWVVWALFVVDYAVRFVLSESRSRFVVRRSLTSRSSRCRCCGRCGCCGSSPC